MAKVKSLNESKKKKDDEYYTLFEDIATELPNYKEQFRGKRIICPCDWDESYKEAFVYKEEGYIPPYNLFSCGGTVKEIDVDKSKEKLERDLLTVKCNFVKYLVAHAEAYGIKSISVSGFNPLTGEGVRFQDIDYGNYDIVITNPPFSQFRNFIDTMFSTGKKFLVIGPTNGITYQNVFKRIQNNEMWLGYHHHMTGFIKSNGELLPKNDALVRYSCWFTNLDVSYRHDKIILTEQYTEEKFPTYCNYDAIHVKSTTQIPYDYDGYISVPITFLQKYNPSQFEIVGNSAVLAGPAPEDIPKSLKGGPRFYLKTEKGYKREFDRLVVKNKEVYHDEN